MIALENTDLKPLIECFNSSNFFSSSDFYWLWYISVQTNLQGKYKGHEQMRMQIQWPCTFTNKTIIVFAKRPANTIMLSWELPICAL